MAITRNHFSISALRAGALFVSALQQSEDPSTQQVRQAIAAAVRQFGSRGCAERVAQEFGEHPELAAARMRWARQAAARASVRLAAARRHAGQQPADCAALSGTAPANPAPGVRGLRPGGPGCPARRPAAGS